MGLALALVIICIITAIILVIYIRHYTANRYCNNRYCCPPRHIEDDFTPEQHQIIALRNRARQVHPMDHGPEEMPAPVTTFREPQVQIPQRAMVVEAPAVGTCEIPGAAQIMRSNTIRSAPPPYTEEENLN